VLRAVTKSLLSVLLLAWQLAAPSNVRISTPSVDPVSVPTSIAWTQQPAPGDKPGAVGWSSLYWDPVSRRTLAYLVPNTTTNIWAMAMYTYDPSDNDWVRLGGENLGLGVCGDGSTSNVKPWPGNRHPIQHGAIDTIRNRFWLLGGVCNGFNRDDLWYYSLNNNPTNNTWANVATGLATPYNLWGNMIYSPDHDALIFFNARPDTFGETWIYCLSVSVGGCGSLHTWTLVRQAALGHTMPGCAPGAFNVSIYDPSIDRLVAFVKCSGGGQRSVWQYDIANIAWTNLNAKNIPSDQPPSTGEALVTRITSGPFVGHYIFHRALTDPSPTYRYDTAGNSFVQLTQLGGSDGPGTAAFLTWNEADSVIVAWTHNGQVWTGSLQ
jgi:hypothetical protein